MQTKILHNLLIICFLASTGCAALPSISSVVKSREQRNVDEARAKAAAAEKSQQALAQEIAKTPVPTESTLTPETIAYRRKILDQQKAYVTAIVAQSEAREAELKKEATNAGYFALSTKGIGIASGIASAILVAASPANAAIVAGLGALSSGTAAFQDTAANVGYSTVVAQTQLEALKDGVNTAYVAFADVPWEYLYNYAEYAKREDWAAEMKKLGAHIIKLEAAVRYTKYKISISANGGNSAAAN